MFRQSYLNAPFQVCQVHDHTGDVINLWEAYIQDLMCTGKPSFEPQQYHFYFHVYQLFKNCLWVVYNNSH